MIEELNEKRKTEKDNKSKSGIIKFKKKELNEMPDYLRNLFVANNRIVKYRVVNGLYQARYRRDGYNIEVASKDFETMKLKFLNKITGNIVKPAKIITSKITFSEYAEKWLKIKQKTTKESTYKEYARCIERDLEIPFGKYPLDRISREKVQDFLFKYIEEGKYRSAEKLKLILSCIFDMASEDFNIQSPMKKIVLPYRETKKGHAFTKKEERDLVEYCKENDEKDTSSALLVLLYAGLRRSELSSIEVIDNRWLQCKTSKERMGKNEVKRRIPFTPMMKNVLSHIDFDKARNVNTNTLYNVLKKKFPNHHLHELRYTFITRVKECGVNMEVSMIWAGHEQDADVKTSKVDRGYTDYSEEYLLSEAEKVKYNL